MIPIRLVEHPVLHGLDPESGSMHYDGTVDFSKLMVGDLCYFHHRGQPCLDPEVLSRLNLTGYYFAHNAGRPPLLLAMPDHASKSPRYFMVDGKCYSNACTRCNLRVYDKCKCGLPQTPRGYYDGWTVTGAPPKITIAPSVNFDEEDCRRYHGFVQNGIIGDG